MNYRVWCFDKNEWGTDKCFVDSKGTVYSKLPSSTVVENKPKTHKVTYGLGFNDEVGREIFEGDILELEDILDCPSKPVKCVVEWIDYKCAWMPRDLETNYKGGR